ncbi:MAG TPA: hypothetical protein VGR43_12030 [Dehalococcoidia bacterium]|jgi:hypothetical protein|nr:hypothetical protein [Dehalococcoidia bacterium]
MNARLPRFGVIGFLVIGGVVLIGVALWLVGPTLALLAVLFFGVVIVPSIIEIAKERSSSGIDLEDDTVGEG